MEVSTTEDPELPSAATLSLSSSGSSSSSHANNNNENSRNSNRKNDVEDSAQRFRDSDIRPSVIPKWLQELNGPHGDNLFSTSHTSLGSHHGSGSAHNRKSKPSSRGSILPDWLHEFEAEQEKLLKTLTSRSSMFSRQSVPPPPAAAAALQDTPNPNMAPEGKMSWDGGEKVAQRQSSVVPDWLKGFEAEQQKLMEAMNRQASTTAKRQDSFALLQDDDDNEEEGNTTIPTSRRSTVHNAVQEIEQQQKTLLQALGKRATILANAESMGVDLLQAEETTTTEPASNRPSVIPDWLLEFENQQKTLLRALDSHTRDSVMAGGDSIFLATENNHSKTSRDSFADLEPSSRHSNASIGSAPDWFKEFEKRQNHIFDELKSSTHHSSRNNNGEWDMHSTRADEHNSDEEDQALFHSKDSSKLTTNELDSKPTTSAKVDASNDNAVSNPTTPSKGNNPYQNVQLRRTPTSVERQKKETNLEFAEMVAKALSKKGNSNLHPQDNALSLEALRHIHNLKQEVAQLQQQEEIGSELWQIHKLRKELLELFEQEGSTAGDAQLLNWLLPMHQERDEKTGQLIMSADQVSLLRAFATSEELDMVSGLGMVKSVLQSNFKAIDGNHCLETIREYAMLKLGKKDQKKRIQQPWEILAEIFETAQADGSTEDLHLRVKNALVTWVVREIMGTSRDKVSSRMCFHAIFLVASLKLELGRVAPNALRKSESHFLCKSIGNENAPVEPKRNSRRKGHLLDTPPVIKKLLDRDQNGPKDAPPVPLDLPPEDENARAGSSKVDFVRETLVTGLHDNLEEQAKITSRQSTFVKINSDKGIDTDAVASAVKAFQLPTNLEDDSLDFSTPNYTPRRGAAVEEVPSENDLIKVQGEPSSHMTDIVGSMREGSRPASSVESENDAGMGEFISKEIELTNESVSLLEEAGEEVNKPASKIPSNEEESNLPLNIQDAHRVIRTILGPSHPNVTVSLCFEAIRVYAGLITTWRKFCGEDGTLLNSGVNIATAGPRPSSEELKLKSLEGTILRRGAIVPAAEINLQLEAQKQQEREKQEEEEKRARDAIARKREEKKKKKLVRNRTSSPTRDLTETFSTRSPSATTSAAFSIENSKKPSLEACKTNKEQTGDGNISRKPRKGKNLKNLARRLTLRPKKSKDGNLSTVQE